ncbi:exodeoxyribonuclease-3 [Arachidicoccus rhizosphaerae]|uniref:Exodeoxyribonuclease-3 n=1 Tax=Arachidicoccus rhizosphaerae TaxID=551991 RepID=A0A1H4CM51_9BACT|nr:exodeoxyribonuclease III [Arachidicoccus rhizosphaerae]SEA61390.1 exodeoxyribonuclease-3 [Arachidicoccus rhizosphaerae]
MRIISYNLNGIRAAIKKGFLDWLATDPADIICIQETKALKTDIDVALIEKLGYHVYWFSAQKKGYSGVAVFTKQEPLEVFYGNGIQQSDFEGRCIRLDFKDFTLINAYFPSGTSGDERQTYKYQWLDELFGYLNELRSIRPNLILTGDYNICHREIDIHDPKGNKKSSGFLPEERAWMDKFFENGFVDSFRHIHPERTGAYSWWSQRFPSVRLNNKGWRIDYISVTQGLHERITGAEIYPDVKHSDHCPIFMEIADLSLS